jgi:hypothetical protein
MARASRLTVMKAANAQSNGALRTAYRTTFREYSIKLEALQQLIGSGAPESGWLEVALLEVEQARLAHNGARDRLARELVQPSVPPHAPVDEQDIRKTARLLWELAGRPEGTAECDWNRADSWCTLPSHLEAKSCSAWLSRRLVE